MKIRFKLIPFLISTLIVVGITFGICWYSYHGYEGNKLKFLDEYFHVDDYEEQPASDLIHNFVEMQFTKYAKGNDKVSIINPDTEEKVTSSTDNSSVLSFNNGTIHVPNYFDIDVYATATYSDSEWTYNYYFYFYNINYKNSTFSLSNLELIIVDGTGRTSDEEEIEDADKLGLDLLDVAYLKRYDEDPNNNPSTTLGYITTFGYTGDADVSATFPIYDSGYTNVDEENDDSQHLVFNMSLKTDINHVSITNPVDSNGKPVTTTGNVSFTLVDTTDDTNVRLFTGSIQDVTSMDQLSYEDGCTKDPLQCKSYGSVVAGKVILHSSIAFVISAVIAVLFYLIWMDPAEGGSDKKGQKAKQPQKNNKKK